MNWLNSRFNLEAINGLGVWLNELKDKLQSFDIKPAKPIVADLWRQIQVARAEENHVEIIKNLNKILLINYRNQEALYNLARLYFDNSHYHKSLSISTRGAKYYPQDYRFFQLAGYGFARVGKLRSSVAAFNRALELNPQCPTIQHFLNAAKQHNSSRASSSYLVELFDGYAETFETCLVDNLQYRSHIDLSKYIRLFSERETFNTVLDLGCGTGLLGQELNKLFKIQDLIGLDLAKNMLSKSEQKGVYQQLHNIDIEEYLRTTDDKYDLIASSDVLIYFGDLSRVFNQAYGCLNPNGYFAFSVEQLPKGDFKLTVTGRYQHSLAYLKSLYNKYGFSKMYSQAIDLRKESGNIVPGYLVLLQK